MKWLGLSCLRPLAEDECGGALHSGIVAQRGQLHTRLTLGRKVQHCGNAAFDIRDELTVRFDKPAGEKYSLRIEQVEEVCNSLGKIPGQHGIGGPRREVAIPGELADLLRERCAGRGGIERVTGVLRILLQQ